jgi:hypothetical protein
MLGHSPNEMQQRFIKYLRERSPEKFSAMRALSLALYFDDDLFDHLVRNNHVGGLPVHDMVPALLSNRSHVRQFDSGGQVAFQPHRPGICNRPCLGIPAKLNACSEEKPNGIPG